MIRKFILLLVFLAIQILIWAQRPLSIEVLKPKVDSVIAESALLFERIRIDSMMNHKAQKMSLNEFKVIIYNKNYSDTLIAILSTVENDFIFEQHFKSASLEPIYQSKNKRSFTENEITLLEFKDAFYLESKKNKYAIDPKPNCYFKFFIIPFDQDYRYFVLTLSEQDSSIHFGNDYIFIFNQRKQLKSWRELTKYKITSVKAEERGSNRTGKIEKLYIKGGKSDNLPESIDLVKLRKYQHRIKNEECSFVCNKRWFIYDTKKDKISIKPFPNERQ